MATKKEKAAQRKKQLEQKGEREMRHIAMAVSDNKQAELEHLRFRDADKSVKGGAMLGFSGLMVAADLVFLSAGEGSFIPGGSLYAWGGFVALFILLLGSLYSTWSILEPGKITKAEYESTFEFFGAVSKYHERTERLLVISITLTGIGTGAFLLSLTLSVLLQSTPANV